MLVNLLSYLLFINYDSKNKFLHIFFSFFSFFPFILKVFVNSFPSAISNIINIDTNLFSLLYIYNTLDIRPSQVCAISIRVYFKCNIFY